MRGHSGGIVSSCDNFAVFSFAIKSDNKKVRVILGCHVAPTFQKQIYGFPEKAIIRSI